MNPISFRGAIAVFLAALPWLNPFTAGPSAAAVPWLLSAVSGLGLFLLAVGGAGQRTNAVLIACCAAIVGWATLAHLGRLDAVPALAAGLALIVLLASAASDQEVGRGLRQGILIAALLSALAGLIQYLGFSEFFGPWINYASAGEAYGNLRQANQFATLCWLGVAVLLWGAPKLTPWLSFPATVVLAAASAASVSRTGMLQGLLLLVLCATWQSSFRRDNLRLCAVAGVTYVAATFLLPIVLEYVTGALPSRLLWSRLSSSYGCSSRAVLWSNVATLISRRPITGWGWGELDYAHFETFYSGPRFCEILDNAHSLPLHLAVELGVPVAMLACIGGVVWCWRQRPWREQQPRRQLGWAVIATILLHNMLEYPLWYGPFQIVFGAALGWLLMDLAPTAADRARARGLAAAVGALLLSASVYAGWDYWRVSQVYLPPQQRREAWRSDPLKEAKRSHLFAQQADFAELTLSTVNAANAAAMAALAEEMLHYSPEPRVVERLIEAKTLLGNDREAVLLLARFRAAYPSEYEAWRRRSLPEPSAQD